ncbi:MAG: DUF503 domain-containing protein [Phycisphaerae bacterium]
MVVGVLTVRLAIYEAESLKDKRRVIKSVKDRLAHRFNVSVAEVDELDSWQRAELGVAMVANDGRFVESCLHKIVDVLRGERSASLVDYHVELL